MERPPIRTASGAPACTSRYTVILDAGNNAATSATVRYRGCPPGWAHYWGSSCWALRISYRSPSGVPELTTSGGQDSISRAYRRPVLGIPAQQCHWRYSAATSLRASGGSPANAPAGGSPGGGGGGLGGATP